MDFALNCSSLCLASVKGIQIYCKGTVKGGVALSYTMMTFY